MSLLVKQYKNGGFQLWSTTAKRYITPPLHKSEIVKVIERLWRKDLDERIEFLRKDFPLGWRDKDTQFLL